MSESPGSEAWNNFVMNSQPEDYRTGDIRKAAALAKLYMGGTNNGGINSFLTNSWEYSGAEVVEALEAVGAQKAAEQLNLVLSGLGVSLPASSQESRWGLMKEHWNDKLDNLDMLSNDSDNDLIRALEEHVKLNSTYYEILE